MINTLISGNYYFFLLSAFLRLNINSIYNVMLILCIRGAFSVRVNHSGVKKARCSIYPYVLGNGKKLTLVLH